MVKIEGLNKVLEAIQGMDVKDWDGTTVVVGYTQSYAVKVHEDLDARHAEGKTAKFLEGPARANGNEIAKVIRTAYQRSKDIKKALMIGGLLLQRKSQEVAPIDTGALRASAFTALDKDVQQESQAAFERSEAIRRSRKK